MGPDHRTKLGRFPLHMASWQGGASMRLRSVCKRGCREMLYCITKES